MEKLKLALLGCGHLNEIVARALKDGYLPEYELVGALGRNSDKVVEFSKKYNCTPCNNIDQLLSLNPDFVAEAASVEAVKNYGERILKNGASLVVLSIGAFADSEFYEQIKNTAFENNKKVYIASGAVGGFDVLRTASLMSPITAKISSKKSPKSLEKTPLYRGGLLDIREKEQVFTGTTKEAIEILPTHVNVAIATALASAGPENTKMKIDALPNFKGDEYKIEIEGEEVKTDLNIYSKTSDIAGWSVVFILQNIVSPIVF
ncbi:aspartate dehydrogenase domain-containing protein [Miniphocaeibacter halophilus]|uniref:DUF108 domain-containing protein n=1 Tax=Miniphocaeibacter halophilus TaxID=2931922 RepID=A0AC61MQW5_9FIRM|nr:aspartate dehydrogenase domain-containing protein [Miniphocaeibacter halophilus]QQK08075.1 DUF108 domain-containing protein [Miniphocaeibacter halophilus]